MQVQEIARPLFGRKVQSCGNHLACLNIGLDANVFFNWDKKRAFPWKDGGLEDLFIDSYFHWDDSPAVGKVFDNIMQRLCFIWIQLQEIERSGSPPLNQR